MASRFPLEENVQLRTRRGHDMKWSCDKHGEPIKFYCEDHTISICHPCATKDHQKPCKLVDIEDVILEMRKRVEHTKTKIASEKKRLKTLRSKLESSETSANNHLQSVNDNVNAAYDGMLNSAKDKERDEIRLINEEADEEIRIINEKRETRIKACKEEAEEQRQTLKDSAAKLLSDMKTISEKVKKKINELESKHQHYTAMVDNVDSKIERMKQDDKTLVQEAPQIIASLDESLSSNVHQEVADHLDRIELAVQRVKFVESEVGWKHYGRIDGCIDKWEPVESFHIPSTVNKPLVRGLISDDKICVSNGNDGGLYVTNISTEHTEKVIKEDSNIIVTSCAPVDSNVIVCGKWRGDCMGGSLDGCITLYDRQWKVIRDITIPRNTSSSSTVYVDVDRDGMIIAAEYYQSNIYVINPADGKIVNTITMLDKKVLDSIHAISSSDIVVQTGRKVFTVISRSGEEKFLIHCDQWESPKCYVDKLTDTLYVTYRYKRRKMIAVDQVSPDGNIQAKRIVEYNGCSYHNDMNYISPCLVTPSGSLAACEGNTLLVYRKSFIVEAISTQTKSSQTSN